MQLTDVAIRRIVTEGVDVALKEVLPFEDTRHFSRVSLVNKCGILICVGVSRHKSEECGNVKVCFHLVRFVLL